MTTHTADCAECDFRIAKVPAQDWEPGSMRPIYLFASSCKLKLDLLQLSIPQNCWLSMVYLTNSSFLVSSLFFAYISSSIGAVEMAYAAKQILGEVSSISCPYIMLLFLELHIAIHRQTLCHKSLFTCSPFSAWINTHPSFSLHPYKLSFNFFVTQYKKGDPRPGSQAT